MPKTRASTGNAIDLLMKRNFAPPAERLRSVVSRLKGVPALMEASGLALDGLRFHSHHKWEQEVNWKVALENYLECYHCAVAHPGFTELVDVSPDAYRLEEHRWFSSQFLYWSTGNTPVA